MYYALMTLLGGKSGVNRRTIYHAKNPRQEVGREVAWFNPYMDVWDEQRSKELQICLKALNEEEGA
jgi:hypothetical protein